MLKKIIFSLFVIALFLCVSFQNNSAFAKINKYMVYFNYDTKEICLLDIESGKIEKKHKMNLNIQQYTINRLGFTYKWHYNNGDANIYLMENYAGGNLENRNSKIYKINMESFDVSEIFFSENSFHNFCIYGSYLYLLRYVEESQGKSNIEKNYIVLHNLTNGNETIINFNQSLMKNEQIYIPDFQVSGNKIVMQSYNSFNRPRKLYFYDIKNQTSKLIDGMLGMPQFSLYADTVLYRRDMNSNSSKKEDRSYDLVIYDLENDMYKTLPYKVFAADLQIVDENTMIYTEGRKTLKSFLSQFWIFTVRGHKNYYIADMHRNKKKLLFHSEDEIKILGVTNKI
jgi:hypothetical protein